MGKTHRSNMAKFLLAAATLAFLAVASATDVYASTFFDLAVCNVTSSFAGACQASPFYAQAAPTNFKITLDKCYLNSLDPVAYYAKVTLSGTTYGFNAYTDSSCATAVGAVTTTAIDTCKEATIGTSAFALRFSSGSAYASGSTSNNDCTSGTCIVEATAAPTPSNSAGHVSVGILSACLAVMAQVGESHEPSAQRVWRLLSCW